MEYEEIEKLWKKYNNRLENLEKMNRKLLKETLLKKPRRKLNWHKFNSLYGLIMVPIILVVALHPNFKKGSFDWKMICGIILTLSVVIYISLLNLKSYLLLKKIDLSTDSILDSAGRIIRFKKLFNSRWKSAFFYYPVLCMGVVLIAWKSFNFDIKTILSLIFLFLVTYSINIFGPKSYLKRISKLEKDIMDLREYSEE